jgi:hypothetical protein
MCSMRVAMFLSVFDFTEVEQRSKYRIGVRFLMHSTIYVPFFRELADTPPLVPE